MAQSNSTAPTIQDMEAKITSLTSTIQQLEKQESKLLKLVKLNMDVASNKEQYMQCNRTKWKCIRQMILFKKRVLNSSILDTMNRSSRTIKEAVQYVKHLDTPSMSSQQASLVQPSFDAQQLNETIIDLKTCSQRIQQSGISFLKTLQQEWNNNLILNKTHNEDDKQFGQELNRIISQQLKSFTSSFDKIEKQRLCLLNAKCNVLIFQTVSHSDILFKLMFKNGQYTQQDIDKEAAKMDEFVLEIKQCMKGVVQISNELQDEATLCNASGHKQKAAEIGKILNDINGKLANLHRALLTMEDIKMDTDITLFLKEKISVIERKIQVLNQDADILKNAARSYIRVEQKQNAKHVLARNMLCVKQQREYTRKLNVLENAMKQINAMKSAKSEQKQQQETETESKEQLENVDYTQWNAQEIVSWIVSLNPSNFGKYESCLMQGLQEGNVKGAQIGMLNTTQLVSLGMDERDAIFVCKQIEQLVSAYNEDLINELDDD